MVEYNELDHVGVQVAVNEDEICQNEDEPIMSLNVSKTFMKSLIELFGSDADDAQLLNGLCNFFLKILSFYFLTHNLGIQFQTFRK